jgi:hypothetical protein
MISIKPGASIKGIRPEIIFAAMVAQEVYRDTYSSLVITSGLDSLHGEHSLHYSGEAIDLRINNLPPGRAVEVMTEIKKRLGAEFDVVLEVDHIHIEFDPKN